MITKAQIADIPALNNLINSAYRGETSKKGWTTEAHLLEGTRTDEKELTEIIQKEGNTIFKLTQNNQIVACVLLAEKENKLYLGMLTVSPELQNSGFGKQLLQHAEAFATTLGLPKIAMTVISIRPELIAWYKRHGYVDTGEREPFPAGFSDVIIGNEALEFVVLEKHI
jgi:ribosomal protein S18 acetylase RimI-like enzyme